ncbi:MAG: electron transfer flavoprotein-ubiquinone oxidoreductase [Alphaproteobacteria bacterium]|nr:electron transfer flavoprotein-ubiquinone oxidoreductase [Alphaproteobacteria bacterium]
MSDEAIREEFQTDVVIVGGGPAGLSAAIRLKQIAAATGRDIAVTLIEKAAGIGGHIISGAVMDTAGLDALIPDWRERGAPVGPKVGREHLHFLTATGDLTLPHALVPPVARTADSHITSLGRLCQWLGEEAAALGVDIFPATAAVDVVTNESGAVTGVVTGDLGVLRDGSPGPGYAPGIVLKASHVLVAEGARGSLAKSLIARFGLDAGSAPQKYSLGIKEIWEIDPERHEPGRVDNYLGFPLPADTSGGGFAYHAEDNKLYLGLVTYLDYPNPTLSPFDEFQRFKTHPSIARLLAGATRLAYGARAITAGGWHAIPELSFPGGGLIGCAAGFMNVPRLKAIHNAMRSGKAAAETVAAALADGRANDRLDDLRANIDASGIAADLRPVANIKSLWSRFGSRLGIVLAGVDMWATSLFGRSPFAAIAASSKDSDTLQKRGTVTPIAYPSPDGVTTFDRAASVFLANIAHDENQPVHLKLADPSVPVERNLPEYGEPAPLYCPAGVYEMAEEQGRPVFRIHAANCVHCKTCDIKDPAQNITWTPPEGGSGPNYSGM